MPRTLQRGKDDRRLGGALHASAKAIASGSRKPATLRLCERMARHDPPSCRPRDQGWYDDGGGAKVGEMAKGPTTRQPPDVLSSAMHAQHWSWYSYNSNLSCSESGRPSRLRSRRNRSSVRAITSWAISVSRLSQPHVNRPTPRPGHGEWCRRRGGSAHSVGRPQAAGNRAPFFRPSGLARRCAASLCGRTAAAARDAIRACRAAAWRTSRDPQCAG